MGILKYEYKTIVGDIRFRGRGDIAEPEGWAYAPASVLTMVADPVPPEGEGWELASTAISCGSNVVCIVARDWRRAVTT